MNQPLEPNRGLTTNASRAVGLWQPYQPVEAAAIDSGERAGSGALLDYWQIVRRHKPTVLLFILLGGVAAMLITLPQTPVYQAKASLEVLPRNENFLNMRDVNPTASEPSYTPEYDVQTQVNVLQSNSTVTGALARMNLATRTLPSELRLSALERALAANANSATDEDRALLAAEKNLRVRARPNTRLVEIRYDSSDPGYAADLVNALIAETIERNLRSRWETAKHTSDWLSRQMEDLKGKLEQSDERLESYARSVGLAFMGQKDNLAEQKLRQVQDELSRAQADRIGKQSRYELAANASVEALPEVLDDVGLKEYQAKLTELRRQLAELTSSFTAAFPKTKKLEAEIAAIESARDKARMNIVERIRNEFDAAKRRERLLTTDYERQLELVSSQSAAVSRYQILKGEADSERQLYESMVQRVKEAGLASALRASNIQIVEGASVPKEPYKPNIALNTALGLLSGIFIGIAYVITREHSDRRIREPGDSAFYLETAELGVIPSARSDRRSNSKQLPQTLSLGAALHENLAVPSHPEVTFWNSEPSALAESFRAILTSILFSSHKDGRPRVVVLSSPNPGEGKTMVASNLAIALARASMRVLLVDGDLRKPRLHEIFGLENKDGLSDILLSPGPEAPPVRVRETSVPALFVLSSGTCSDTNLLYTSRLPEVIGQLRQEFDMVLIDTPPMLHMPDARVLGRHADAVVLVIRSRRTTKDAALLARQRFMQDGTTVLGTILNDWNPQSSSAYGYEGYYERYRPYAQTATAEDTAIRAPVQSAVGPAAASETNPAATESVVGQENVNPRRSRGAAVGGLFVLMIGAASATWVLHTVSGRTAQAVDSASIASPKPVSAALARETGPVSPGKSAERQPLEVATATAVSTNPGRPGPIRRLAPRAFKTASLQAVPRPVTAATFDAAPPPSVPLWNGDVVSLPPSLPASAPEPAPPPRTGPAPNPPPTALRPIGGQLQPVQPLDLPSPKIPGIVKERRVSGIVSLDATVDKAGAVTNIRVVRGNPLLIEAAREAVARWKYRPAILDGQPIEAEVHIEVRFDGGSR